MSDETNQEILKEASSFLEAMLESAKEEVENKGQAMGMFFMPVRRKTYPSHLAQGMRGKIRHHGENGEIKADIDVDEHTNLDDALAENDLEEGTQGTPVFSFPFIDNREVGAMAVALAFKMLNDVKFICLVTEAWASDQKSLSPSKDPDRSEVLIGWCLSFDDKSNILGYHSEIIKFTRGEYAVTWMKGEGQQFETSLSEIKKQPLVGNIIDRIVEDSVDEFYCGQ